MYPCKFWKAEERRGRAHAAAAAAADAWSSKQLVSLQLNKERA